HLRGAICKYPVDHICIQYEQFARIIAPTPHAFLMFRIAHEGDGHLVELQIAATRPREGSKFAPIGLNTIVPKKFKLGVDISIDAVTATREVVNIERSGNGEFWSAPCARAQESKRTLGHTVLPEKALVDP